MPLTGRLLRLAVPLAAAAAVVAACTAGGGGTAAPAPAAGTSAGMPEHPGVTPGTGSPVPAVAPGDRRVDVYSHTRAGMFSPKVVGDPARVYVPNLADGTVSVIDQSSMAVIDTIKVGSEPQHVVPSWDLRTLWVNNNRGNTLTPIDPRTGTVAGPAMPVPDPYNLYFTQNGRSALVMAEANTDIDFYDPHSFRLQHRLHLGPMCAGVNHVDFAPDGSYLIATCEFAGRLVKVDVARQAVVGYLDLGRGAAPQDIKIDPFGKIWYVADMNANGLHEIDGNAFTKVGFLPTGLETHGLYPSRDGRFLYVANRGGVLQSPVPPFPHSGGQGSVSVVDVRSRKVVATWPIPNGTPDMGNVSADGSRLWLSGRRSNEVYVLDTRTGALVARIPVGHEPHGLAVWPLPGRFSLGHTGILR